MKKKSLVIGLLSLALGMLILVVIFASRSGAEKRREIDSVTAQKDGNTLTVSRDGHVVYKTSKGVFEDFWDRDKTDAFFAYINKKYFGEGETITGGKNYIIINGQTSYLLTDDELIDQVADETSGSSPPGVGGSGGETGGSGSESGPTPTPTGGGGSGGNSSDSGGSNSECLYWRLSYCVRLRTPSPTPSATPVEVYIREPNCEANTQTGRTVIGNELCLPTPSPTP